MKEYITKNLILLMIALFSAAGLFLLSYLTILNYSFEMEEQYIVACNAETINEFENSIKFGKSIESYYGLSQLLGKASELLRDGCILVIKDKDCRDISSTEPMQSFSVDTSEYGAITQEITDKDGKTAGSLITYYPKQGVRDDIKPAMIRSAVGSAVIAFLLLVCFLAAGALKNVSWQRLVYVMIAGIMIQGGLLTFIYAPQFETTVNKSVYGIAGYLKETFDSMTDKGITVDDISNLNKYLADKQKDYSWISSIEMVSKGTAADENTYIVPIENSSEDIALQFNISSSYIRRNITEMVLTFIATIVIAVIVMKESISLSSMISFRRSEQFGKRCSAQFASIAQVLRYSTFLSSTFSYMCLSFAALQIKEWNEGFWGLSPEMAAALSISICSLAEAAGMLIMPAAAAKLNSRLLYIVSTVLLIASNFACFFTHSALVIVAMRFIAGIGFAGNKQITNMMIAMGYDTEDEKSANLAASNYGIIGGILCGMGLGSIIAGVFGYSATFCAAGAGCLLYLIFSLHCVPWTMLSRADDHREKHDLRKMPRIFSSSAVWKNILLVVMPQYFFLMVIVSLIPGRIQSGGFSPVVLTYANLLNGVLGLYVGEILGRYMTKRLGRSRSLAIMLTSGVAGILILELPTAPVVMILVSAMIMGFIDGVGTPLAADIFLSSKNLSETVGEDTALMVYSLLGFLFMTIAPVVLELCERSPVVMFASCAVLTVMAAALFIGSAGSKNASGNSGG